jgi:hypothetical protein
LAVHGLRFPFGVRHANPAADFSLPLSPTLDGWPGSRGRQPANCQLQTVPPHGEVFASVRPATSMVAVGRLIDPDMLVEIEAEAIL